MKVKTGFGAALIALSLLVSANDGFAQSNYPDRTVRLLVGYAPGGPVDIIGRLFSDKLAELWKQPVVVENITGAAANVAGDRVAKAAPDGYTLLVATNPLLSVNPSLYGKMPFDPNKDLTPITLAVYSPNLFVVPNDVPAKTVQELIAYAKANPGKLTYGSSGAGTTQHLAGELFNKMAGVDIQHVPYRGASAVITDLLGGRLTMFIGSITPLLPHVREGKLRALAITSATRFHAVPDLPTMVELGYPGFVSVLSIGLMAPTGTPPAIIGKIHDDAVKVLAMPDVKERLKKTGMEVIASTPAEFTAAIAAETPIWAKVIKDANIKASN